MSERAMKVALDLWPRIMAEQRPGAGIKLITAALDTFQPEWRLDMENAPMDQPLLLACGGVLVGHRFMLGGVRPVFEDADHRVLRATAWMLAPELPAPPQMDATDE